MTDFECFRDIPRAEPDYRTIPVYIRDYDPLADDNSPWLLMPDPRTRQEQLKVLLSECLQDAALTIRWPLPPGRALARRKWLVYSDPDRGWWITAPNGRRRWYTNHAELRACWALFYLDVKHDLRCYGLDFWDTATAIRAYGQRS